MTESNFMYDQGEVKQIDGDCGQPSEYSGRSQTSVEMRKTLHQFKNKFERIENQLRQTKLENQSLMKFIVQQVGSLSKQVSSLSKQVGSLVKQGGSLSNQAGSLSKVSKEAGQKSIPYELVLSAQKGENIDKYRSIHRQDYISRIDPEAEMIEDASLPCSTNVSGKKTRLQLQMKQQLVEQIRKGEMTREQAAKEAGVDQRTIYRWCGKY